ncbi:MAG: hypothetical protein ACREVY_04500 [Gammaproteobacteria bacterium]
MRRIERNSREGLEYIFIVGWCEEYANKVIELKGQIPTFVASVLDTYTLRKVGRTPTAALLVCQSNLTYLSRVRELQHEVEQALQKEVPEIQAGEVQVTSIARQRGVATKIAVRDGASGELGGPVAACIGPNNMRLKAIRQALNDENVHFIQWSDNPSHSSSTEIAST